MKTKELILQRIEERLGIRKMNWYEYMKLVEDYNKLAKQ